MIITTAMKKREHQFDNIKHIQDIIINYLSIVVGTL
jgi:hypothetical protein